MAFGRVRSSVVDPRTRRWLVPAVLGLLIAARAARIGVEVAVPEPLAEALADLRATVLDPDRLVRAVAAGRRHGWRLRHSRGSSCRPVDLKAGRRLLVAEWDGTQTTTSHVEYGDEATARVDALLAQPYGNWHVETVDVTVQLRVTKKGAAQVHRAAAERRQRTGHDRHAHRILADEDPLFAALDADADKRRQVEAFLRLLDPVLRPGSGRRPPGWSTWVRQRGPDVRRLPAPDRRPGAGRPCVGVDVKAQAREHNDAVAAGLGWSEAVTFVQAASSTRRSTWPLRSSTSCWPSTRATPRPTTPSPGRCGGPRRWCWPPRAATTTCSASSRRRPRLRRTPLVSARDPSRAVRRRPHRRRPGRAAPAARLPGRGARVHRVPAHPAQHVDPRRSHRCGARPGAGSGLRRADVAVAGATAPGGPARRRARPRAGSRVRVGRGAVTVLVATLVCVGARRSSVSAASGSGGRETGAGAAGSTTPASPSRADLPRARRCRGALDGQRQRGQAPRLRHRRDGQTVATLTLHGRAGQGLRGGRGRASRRWRKLAVGR